MKKFFQRMSLGQKIFAGTLLVFLLSFILLLLGQLVFFNHYYTYLVRNNLENSVSALSVDYLSWENRSEINAGIVQASNKSGSYIMILGENGEIRHLVSYEMTIEAPDKKQYRIALDGAIKSKTFQDMKLKVGTPISVHVRYHRDIRENIFYVPYQISSEKKKWNESADFRPFSPDLDSEFENMVITGTITSILIPDENGFGTNLPRNETFRAAMYWRQTHMEKKSGQDTGISHYQYTDAESGNLYTVVFCKLYKNSRPETILAIAPMRSVVEAVSVSGKMSTVWGIFAICVAGIIGFFFSRIISRPILKMSVVTKKMRNLDFSEHCEVKGQDEIGILAQNINKMSDKLNETITQLTEANAQLKSDIEQERLLEQQRKEFVANISHELKTPLSIIRAYTEALSDGISPEKQAHYLSVIIEETRRMDELVLDMLENAKLESGAQQLECTTQNLAVLTEKIIRRFEKSIQKEHIRLLCNLETDGSDCSFDRHWMSQVISNFLTNAIAHTQADGEIRIVVRDGYFSIENTGKPIPDCEQNRVWERFYKTDRSRTRSAGGTGLGLAIAKNILNLHHAEYGIENVSDGVRFWFSLK